MSNANLDKKVVAQMVAALAAKLQVDTDNDFDIDDAQEHSDNKQLAAEEVVREAGFSCGEGESDGNISECDLEDLKTLLAESFNWVPGHYVFAGKK